MPSSDDDESLAKLYTADGNARALEILFRRHSDSTYGFAARFLNCREDVEEATSESWMRVFKKLRADEFAGQSLFRTWLFGIVRHVCLERLRQPRLPTLSLSLFDDGAHADHVLFAPETEPASDLDTAFAKIGEDHQLILNLCDLQGFTVLEASEIFGRSPSATKSLHARARRALRDVMIAQRTQE